MPAILDPSGQVFKPTGIILPEESSIASIEAYGFPDKSPPRWRDMVTDPLFYTCRHRLPDTIDTITKRWIRNASDERAAALGCRFNEKKGQFVVDWITRNCRLYEGSRAGQHMILEDWQYEFIMQMFGWQRFDHELEWQDSNGIERVGKWIRRFTKASIWIPKKNGKSPTLAAVGLYMLIGDGEPGQKCYSVARDSKQAMISHKHAIAMIEASPELSAECTVNHQTGLITHKPTKSEFIVVSDNSESTEGYNGSLFVDETHVVNDKLIKRMKRAGISRHEPVHIEVSTAGDNVDGYGYKQYEKAKKIQSGENKATNVLVMDFAVDQATPVEFFHDPEKVKSIAKKVNPALGRIIRMNEFMNDWAESQESEKETREFAMYRCNLWLTSSVSWIPLADWKKCARKFTLSTLVNTHSPTTMGLDLSKAWDITSLSVAFGVPDAQRGIVPCLYTWSWICEESAKRFKGKIDFRKFMPRLIFCPGSAIDYNLVIQKMNWVRDNTDFRGVACDPYNADIIAYKLQHEHGWGDNEIFGVRQNISHMGPPTKEFERMALRQDLAYDGNPLIDWMIGHCYTEQDKHGNMLVVKPLREDYRKVDGVISQILAVAKMNSDPTIACNYTDSVVLVRAKEQQTVENLKSINQHVRGNNAA